MTYFISGHRDLTWEEFAKWYAPAISKAFHEDKDASFVVGDCEGADRMAQDYLMAVGVDPRNVMVFSMSKRPRYGANIRMHVAGGYENDIKRDEAMTSASHRDIAFVRKGKEDSGTAQNIIRRWTRNL